MSDLNKIKIIQSLSKLYLSLFAINYVAGKPADEKASDSKTEKTEKTDTDDSKTETTETSSKKTDTTSEKTESSSDSVGVSKIPSFNQRTKCQPNTKSCDDGYSCVRFNGDGENNFTCVQTDLAFCDNEGECQSKLGGNYKYCYMPPWANSSNRKQCFTEQVSGSHCLYDIHCVNNLSCVKNVCVSSTVGNLEDTTTPDINFDSKQKGNGTILGINKWIFISAVSFPVLVLILCIWCWLIGRSSSKKIENKKKEKYEKELKDLTVPGQKKDKAGSETTYVNPQKEIEEEVGKRGFRSLFSKKKGEDVKEVEEKDNNNDELDISTSKVGGKPPINTSTTNDTQKKMKNNLTLNNVAEKNGARTRKNAGIKSPSTPASSVASFANSTASSAQGKPRTKKKATGVNTAGKKTKKTTSSSNNDTTNSTSSKQSSQRGLVNNASNMSSALSGQSASYFSTVSSLDPQSALYYQQMYQAAAQNPYYASYMQNPYYAAAAQAAAAQSAAYYAQDPSALYNYQNQSGYQ